MRKRTGWLVPGWLIPEWRVPVGVAMLVTGLSPAWIGAQGTATVKQTETRPIEKNAPLSGGMQKSGTEARVTLVAKDSTVGYVVHTLARQAKMRVAYDTDNPLLRKLVSINVKNMPLMQAMRAALQGTGLVAAVASDGETIIVRNASAQNTQPAVGQDTTGIISGIVKDSTSGRALAGVTVTLRNTSFSTITGQNGHFLLRGVPSGEGILQFRFLGYKSTSVPITISSEQRETLIQVLLVTGSAMLSEVVTTATGTQRRVEVGNDIVTIDVQDVIQKNPVSTVTDLLATRVPGLVVGRASGEPGAKTEIRIRGTSSLRASMEPIVFIDGVQVIANRADADATGFATSPIDQLDVNAISKIEVLKGPSAVALYGSNAANGVIIVTTKRGREGPAHWTTVVELSQETLPGKWPLNYFAWGEDLTSGLGTVHCSRLGGASSSNNPQSVNWGVFPTCRYDSTTVYQVLNDPQTTVFGRGMKKKLSLGVDGSMGRFTYSVTGRFEPTLGLLKVPDADVDILKKSGIGLTTAQRRPQALDTYSGTATFFLGIGDRSDIQYTTMLTRQDKRSSPLSRAISGTSEVLLNPPLALYDRDGVRIGVGSGVLVAVPEFMAGQNSAELRSTNSARYKTPLWSTIIFEATGGLDVSSGRETYLLETGDFCPLSGPINVAFGSCVSSGASQYQYESYRLSSIANDVHLKVSDASRGYKWLNLTPVIGFDLMSLTSGKSGIAAEGLPVGGRGIRGAEKIMALSDAQVARRTVGMFAQTTLNIANRIYLPFGVRTDAGNAIGSEAKPIFPNVGLSYLVSDQPNFRNFPLIGRLPELRFRTSFGIAGRQPGLADKYRTFTFSRFPVDNVDVDIANVNSIGNTRLSPEVSQEWEFGFDATVIDNARSRLSGIFTLAHKRTSNLLTSQRLPPSLGIVESRIGNIGDAVNNNIEIFIEGFQRMGMLDWTTTNGVTTQNSKLVRNSVNLEAIEAFSNKGGAKIGGIAVWNRVGYPIGGLWAYPTVGYVDQNENGTIDPNEVIYGDSAQYVGTPTPRFTFTSNNIFTLAARLTITASLRYEDGGVTRTEDYTNAYSRVMNDPTLSPEEQVRVLYDGVASGYRISTLQFQSLQVTYNMPTSFIKRYLGAKSVLVAVSGTNLGLWSTFSGKDPTVGGIDRSQIGRRLLPIPRTYGISVRVQ